MRCGKKRIARLMRSAGLQGVHRAQEGPHHPPRRRCSPAPDLVDRNFVAEGPPTGCGSPTSPTSADGRGGSIWRSCSTRSRGGSWGGRCPITCAPISSWTRLRSPCSCSAPKTASCCTPIADANTRASPSGGAARSFASLHRWDPRRRRLRQRADRELLRHARDRALGPGALPDAPPSPHGDLRLHRSFLHPPQASPVNRLHDA